MKNEIFEDLKNKTRSSIENYENDLLIHDKKCINDSENAPFIHWAGVNGTHIAILYSPDKYPALGERVKYLFSRADRHHILNQKVEIVNCLKTYSGIKLVH